MTGLGKSQMFQGEKRQESRGNSMDSASDLVCLEFHVFVGKCWEIGPGKERKFVL